MPVCAIHKHRTKQINQHIRWSNTTLLMKRKQSPSEQNQIAVGIWKDLHIQQYRQGFCSISQLVVCVSDSCSVMDALKAPDQSATECALTETRALRKDRYQAAQRSWPWMHEWKWKGPDTCMGVELLNNQNTWMSGTWVTISDRFHYLR